MGTKVFACRLPIFLGGQLLWKVGEDLADNVASSRRNRSWIRA